MSSEKADQRVVDTQNSLFASASAPKGATPAFFGSAAKLRGGTPLSSSNSSNAFSSSNSTRGSMFAPGMSGAPGTFMLFAAASSAPVRYVEVGANDDLSTQTTDFIATTGASAFVEEEKDASTKETKLTVVAETDESKNKSKTSVETEAKAQNTKEALATVETKETQETKETTEATETTEEKKKATTKEAKETSKIPEFLVASKDLREIYKRREEQLFAVMFPKELPKRGIAGLQKKEDEAEAKVVRHFETGCMWKRNPFQKQQVQSRATRLQNPVPLSLPSPQQEAPPSEDDDTAFRPPPRKKRRKFQPPRQIQRANDDNCESQPPQRVRVHKTLGMRRVRKQSTRTPVSNDSDTDSSNDEEQCASENVFDSFEDSVLRILRNKKQLVMGTKTDIWIASIEGRNRQYYITFQRGLRRESRLVSRTVHVQGTFRAASLRILQVARMQHKKNLQIEGG